MTQKPRCPVCESGDIIEGGPYRATHVSFQGIRRVRCRDCCIHFADPMPSDEALASYNARYFENAHGGAAARPDERAFFTGIAAVRISHVHRYICARGAEVSSVLEVGPGAGDFAKKWLAQHPAARYFGIETDTSCHAALATAGLELLSSNRELPEVDLLILSHVLEHVTNPISFLRPFVKKLRPNGTLFIEVPCNDWQHKQVVEPHLLFFDKTSMAKLLEQLGFNEIELSYHGRTIRSLQSDNVLSELTRKLRGRLVHHGVTWPFASPTPGIECLTSPLERAVMKPWQAHVEQTEPAWWLRALATKP